MRRGALGPTSTTSGRGQRQRALRGRARSASGDYFRIIQLRDVHRRSDCATATPHDTETQSHSLESRDTVHASHMSMTMSHVSRQLSHNKICTRGERHTHQIQLSHALHMVQRLPPPEELEAKQHTAHYRVTASHTLSDRMVGAGSPAALRQTLRPHRAGRDQ